MLSRTGCRLNAERLMTLSTSAVAVCCASDFAQFVEQARVLDRDHGLPGKVLDQLDLLLGKRSDLLAVDGDRANQPALFEQRHNENCTGASEVRESDGRWIALKVRWSRPKIVDAHYLFGPGDRAKATFRMGTDHLIQPPGGEFGPGDSHSATL